MSISQFGVPEAFSKINMEDIDIVTLAKMIREYYKFSLVDSLKIAKLLKQTHRLGVIRGQVVNSLSKLK